MTEITKKALDVAITQIGQEEKPRGSNWGTPVKDYLASVGINFPASWCMSFIYWCYDEARKEMLPPPANPLFKTGGVLHQLQKSFTKQVANHIPQPGDIFIMDLGHGLGHTGFVEGVSADGKFISTVEGNTNDTGSREGFEVCRRARKIDTIKSFLRF